MDVNNEVVQSTKANKNPFGVTGFILSLVALLTCWIPFFGWIVWILGLIFSSIGVAKKNKRGLAVAGFVIGLVIFVFLFIEASLFMDEFLYD